MPQPKESNKFTHIRTHQNKLMHEEKYDKKIKVSRVESQASWRRPRSQAFEAETQFREI
jgi:hypothetical protein